MAAVAGLILGEDVQPRLSIVREVRRTVRSACSPSINEVPDARPPALLAIRGPHVAYAAGSGGVARRMSDGSFGVVVRWEGRVTALAFVDDAGTLVAATYSEADDTTTLVRVDTAGVASVVARTGPTRADSEADGRVLGMAYDEARGVVWVAGGFGVAAFAIR